MIFIKLLGYILGGILVLSSGFFAYQKFHEPSSQTTQQVTDDFNLSSTTVSIGVKMVGQGTTTESLVEEKKKVNITPKPSQQEPSKNIVAPVAAVSSEDKFSSEFVDESKLEGDNEKVNIKAVVLVRCLYKSQYFKQSSQPWDEIIYVLGTGVFVTKTGYIITAGHVVRKESIGTDEAGRIWTFDKCQVARTLNSKMIINANLANSRGDDANFEDVDIVFESNDADYLESAGMDIAVLKLKTGGSEDYVSLYPDLVRISTTTYSITAIGYPGRDVHVQQELERFDGASGGMMALNEDDREVKSTCQEGNYAQICGWRYLIGRNYQDFDFTGYYDPFQAAYTSIGLIADTVKGGFSGSPTFFKGKLIGLLTHGHGHDTTGIYANIDFAEVLTSRDIFKFLVQKGIKF